MTVGRELADPPPAAPQLPTRLLLCYYTQLSAHTRLQKMLLRIDFNFTEITTAHCSVPMLKRPSNEAGPSHRWCCAELASPPLPPALCPCLNVQAMRRADLLDGAVLS